MKKDRQARIKAAKESLGIVEGARNRIRGLSNKLASQDLDAALRHLENVTDEMNNEIQQCEAHIKLIDQGLV